MSPDREWGQQIRAIARGWLFSDVPPDRFPRSVVLPLENPDLHDPAVFLSRLSAVERYGAIALGRFRDRAVGVLSSKFGAPAVAMTVDVLADLGVRSIVGVGYCGAFAERIACGDLVLPLAGVRDDGTSRQYVGEGYPAVADLSSIDVLRNLADTSGRPWYCGIIWSTDAILRETTASVREWAGRGVIGVDMETGALLTVARLAGVRAVAILVASDNPLTGRETETDKLAAGTRAAAALAMEFAAAVSID